jgi:hypothetical protein
MSERGLFLALQRLHDDPGFIDMVSQDPQTTLGIYDLDEAQCEALIQAVNNRDDAAIRRMASEAGIDWTSDHVGGPGALNDTEVSLENKPKTGIHGPSALTGDGYEGVQPHYSTGA